MSTEQLIRDFYNAMHSVHTQSGNAYDMGDHLHDLTVHKHLDQDPLIQFREAYQWVHHAGAQFVADAGCGYGGFAVFVASQAPAIHVDSYPLSDVQQAVAQQVFPACTCRTRGCCCRAMTASYGSTRRLSPSNRSATRPMWLQPSTIGPGIYGQGV